MAHFGSTSRLSRPMSLDELQTLLESTPTSLDQLREKLRARLLFAGGLQRLVNEAELLAQILADVEGLAHSQDDEWLDYAAASRASGYSAKQLNRFAEAGTVEATGQHRNRRFRRGSLPLKPALGTGNADTTEATGPAPGSPPIQPLLPPTRSSPWSASAPAPMPPRPSTPVAARRGNPYDPSADAQRFARVGTSMRKNL